MNVRRKVGVLGPAPNRTRTGFFRLTLLLAIGLSGFYLSAIRSICRYDPVKTSFGWTDTRRDGSWIVTEVDPQGPAAGLLDPGDRLLAFDGDTRAARTGAGVFEDFLAAGSSYSIRVSRNSQQRQISLSPRRSPRGKSWSLTLLFVSLSFFGVGVALGLMKPEDKVTQLGCLALLATAIRLLAIGMWSYPDVEAGLEGTLLSAARITDPWHLMLGYHFYYRFAGNLLREKLWSVLKALLYVTGLVFFVPNATVTLLNVLGQQSLVGFAYQFPSFLAFHDAVYRSYLPYEAFCLLAMCAAVAATYARVRDPDHRRRVRWVVFGSLAGLSPVLLDVAVNSALDPAGLGTLALDRLWPYSTQVANLCLAIIPYATGYAIVKHRAMGISVVVRQSVKYLLARNVLQVVLLLPVMGLILPVVRNPNRTVSELFLQNATFVNLLLLAALSLGLKYRFLLRRWVDQRFFREAYNQEKILRELIGKIKELDSVSEISSLVSHEVESALHPRCLSVFYREKEKSDLTLGYSSGGGSSGLRIPETSRILQLVEESRRPLDYPLPRGFDLPGAEREWLERLGTCLIVPITGGRQRLVGLLLLGEKMSEEPYTPTDRNLLEVAAAQMGIVHERVWLKEQIGEERRIKREVLVHLAETDVNLLKECPRCGACFDSAARACDGDGTELTLTLPVERAIDGKYRLDRRIGKGGMGAVYEATDLRLNRKIAIKIMVGSLFGNREALRRFEREARASAHLNHPNIVALYDFGMIGQDGAYLVMERVYGSTWRAELERRERLAPEVAADWFNQLLNGLRTAHEAGVVHRDLKPENALVTPLQGSGELIKILDFGLAKMRRFEGGGTQSITMIGAVLGTVGYMSPEQLAGRESDERSDIFSVGVMVIEAITGARPFEGRSYSELATSMLSEPRLLPGDSPEVLALNALLARCLARDPADRFHTVAEMQGSLVSALRACPPGVAGQSQSADIPTRNIGPSNPDLPTC